MRPRPSDLRAEATMLAIAAAAEVNVSMVMRYYVSKDDLFATAAQIDLRTANLTDIPVGKRGERIVRHSIQRWEGPNSGDELPALVRSAATNETARQRIVALNMAQVGAEIAPAVSQANFEQCLALIFSTLMGVAYARYVVRHPLVVALNREVLIQTVGATLQTYLDASET